MRGYDHTKAPASAGEADYDCRAEHSPAQYRHREQIMRITPDHPRLRIVAVACLALGSWLMLQPGRLSLAHTPLLASPLIIAAALLLALGIAFWLLGTDRRAGVIFDSKGLSLNLGHSASFVAWENIAAVGVSSHRANLFALGSRRLIGIRLHRPAEYLQSYEARLPASRGLLAAALRLISQAFRRVERASDAPSLASLAQSRRRSGYDLLIPEALLGGRATAFVEIIDAYRTNRAERQSLRLPGAARGA